MAADTQAQEWVGYHGEDMSIVLTGEDNTNPSGYALAFVIAEYPGGSALLTITQSSMTFGGSGPYTITIPLTRAQTGTTLAYTTYPDGKFTADLWRTDSGSNQRLAGGKLTLLRPVRSPS